jgi:hypothetical protein
MKAMTVRLQGDLYRPSVSSSLILRVVPYARDPNF